jgi:uncharacterized protein YabN with tetrapyrrole methylase and pyrophosphatase domain
MIRRHPHVFGNVSETRPSPPQLGTPEKQRRQSNLKLESSTANLLYHQLDTLASRWVHTIPLFYAPSTHPQAARIGFDWPNVEGIFDKLREVLRKKESDARVEGELGDILFVAVNLSRFLNVDPEIALHKASAKFTRRFHQMEKIAREKGTALAEIPRPQLESLWDQSKQLELSQATSK